MQPDRQPFYVVKHLLTLLDLDLNLKKMKRLGTHGGEFIIAVE